jgi:hypothetical protein
MYPNRGFCTALSAILLSLSGTSESSYCSPFTRPRQLASLGHATAQPDREQGQPRQGRFPCCRMAARGFALCGNQGHERERWIEKELRADRPRMLLAEKQVGRPSIHRADQKPRLRQSGKQADQKPRLRQSGKQIEVTPLRCPTTWSRRRPKLDSRTRGQTSYPRDGKAVKGGRSWKSAEKFTHLIAQLRKLSYPGV